MKKLLPFLLFFICLASCKNEPIQLIDNGWKVEMSDTIHKYVCETDGFYLYSNMSEGERVNLQLGSMTLKEIKKKGGSIEIDGFLSMKFLCKRDDGMYVYCAGWEDVNYDKVVNLVCFDEFILFSQDEGFQDTFKLLNMYIKR